MAALSLKLQILVGSLVSVGTVIAGRAQLLRRAQHVMDIAGAHVSAQYVRASRAQIVVAGAFDQPSRATRQNAHMKTLDDMRERRLLSAEQHANIAAWVAGCDGPEAIMAMPSDLWRALSLASVLMNIDAELTQPPHLGF